MKNELTPKHKKIISAVCIVIFIAIMLLLCWDVGRPLVKFVSEPEKFRAWLDAKGYLGRLAFTGMIVMQVFIAFIPGEPFEIGAGYAFGAVEGTFLCLLGALIGSAAVFLFVRVFGVRAVEVFFEKKDFDTAESPIQRDFSAL